MKDKLLAILKDIDELLTLCGYKDKALWFKERANKIKDLDEKDKNFKSELIELQKVIAGIGSFHDLPLYPIEGSGLTEAEAESRQWRLADELGIIIRQFLQDA